MRKSLLCLAYMLTAAPMALSQNSRLESFTYNGSGCPVQAGQAPRYGFDGQWLTVELSQVKASKSGSPEDSRKNCSVTVRFSPLSGYRYALERVIAWGNYRLDGSDQFVFQATSFFEGNSGTASLETSAYGPSWWRGYTFDRSLSQDQLVWSSCGRARAISFNASARIASEAQGDSSGSEAWLDKVAYKMVYQRCDR